MDNMICQNNTSYFNISQNNLYLQYYIPLYLYRPFYFQIEKKCQAQIEKKSNEKKIIFKLKKDKFKLKRLNFKFKKVLIFSLNYMQA